MKPTASSVSTISFLLLALANFITAAPWPKPLTTSSPASNITSRNIHSAWGPAPFIAAPDPNQSCASSLGRPGAVYFCPKSNFANSNVQTCTWQSQMGICITWATGNRLPISIGPDPRTYCVLYDEQDCKGSVVKRLECPGFRDSVQIKDGTGKRWFQSMVCWDVV